ncbi:serine hydrolase [Pontibacter sp. HSC-36F09]|uniref:serine hydrolase domain-containing protein n=1 Tax=Pontibacter sp. HSC-36F09 TaxID=2910966 RepID=UPI0020A1280F|nr:serine hydrolase domain-containing protein [Pontibacter sp. HSC-36F09]MCP2044402.1 CubicO group peptidase (beta-lactamase class C family) [Pontibacter sp. HSC-36F09]
MLKNLWKKVSLTSLALITFTLPSHAQNDKTEADLQAIMQQHDMVGLAVVVVKKGDIVYNRSFGLKDVESQTPLSNSDIFRIASISKSFTVTALMQLIEAGKLSLNDDVSKLVGFQVRNPKYPNKVITLRMMLSHTSSINDSQGYFTLDTIDPAKNPNWAACYNDYEPGTKYEYCNLGFNMAGTILEKLTGERFDQYVKHHILDPLGLYGGYNVDSLDASRFVTLYEYNPDSSRFSPSPSAYNPRRQEIRNYKMGYSTPIFSPTGGMKISATDLAKYMTMHMNKGEYNGTRIISKKSAKKMQSKIADNGYGLALKTEKNLIPGKAIVGHTGNAYGLYSAMFFQPKEQFGFVVITNGTSAPEVNEYNVALAAVINSLYNNLVK